MSYAPTTDFLALLRNTGGGERTLSMPGLDYVVSALARAGLFTLYVGQTAPTVNQATTVWLQPSVPSWVAEGAVMLWNAAAGQYQLATTALWAKLLNPSYAFQSIVSAAGSVVAGTSLLAIQRAAPVATAVQLPSVSSQGSGKVLRIVDWSTAVVNHDITLTAAAPDTIMLQPTWQLLSTAAQLSGVALYPSTDLGGWVVAP
jgi:hypothetical protein